MSSVVSLQFHTLKSQSPPPAPRQFFRMIMFGERLFKKVFKLLDFYA